MSTNMANPLIIFPTSTFVHDSSALFMQWMKTHLNERGLNNVSWKDVSRLVSEAMKYGCSSLEEVFQFLMARLNHELEMFPERIESVRHLVTVDLPILAQEAMESNAVKQTEPFLRLVASHINKVLECLPVNVEIDQTNIMCAGVALAAAICSGRSILKRARPSTSSVVVQPHPPPTVRDPVDNDNDDGKRKFQKLIDPGNKPVGVPPPDVDSSDDEESGEDNPIDDVDNDDNEESNAYRTAEQDDRSREMEEYNPSNADEEDDEKSDQEEEEEDVVENSEEEDDVPVQRRAATAVQPRTDLRHILFDEETSDDDHGPVSQHASSSIRGGNAESSEDESDDNSEMSDDSEE